MLIEHAEQKVREGCEATLRHLVSRGMIRSGIVDSVECTGDSTFIVKEHVRLMPIAGNKLINFTLNIDPTQRNYEDFEGFDDVPDVRPGA